MSLCLTFKRLEGPPCVTVLSHKGPSNKSMWQYLDLCLFRYVFFMSLYLTSKRLEGPQCVTVLSHKGPWRDSLVWKNCPIRDTGGTPFCLFFKVPGGFLWFLRFQVGFSRFQVSISWFQVNFDGSAGFFYGNSCNSGTESQKIDPKVGNERPLWGLQTGRWPKLGSYSKNRIFGKKPRFWAQKKGYTSYDSPCSSHARKKVVQRKKVPLPK